MRIRRRSPDTHVRIRGGRRPLEAGFSLIEITVAAGIAIVAFCFVGKMAVLAFDAWSEGEGRMRFQERTAQGMQRIAREVRQADATTLAAAGGSLRFQVPADLDGDGTVLDPDGETEYSPEITYSLTDANLVREQDQDGDGVIEDDVPGERTIVASGLSAINFASVPPGVRVAMTLEILPVRGGADPRLETVTGVIRTGNRSEES